MEILPKILLPYIVINRLTAQFSDKPTHGKSSRGLVGKLSR